METKKHIFSVMEKKHFRNILRSYKHIIENKETDAHTIQIKNNAWEEITSEYNASPHCTYQVSTKQLRRLWLNLKQRQKVALTMERQQRMATGGGPAINDVVNDPEIAALPPAVLVNVENPIDSDTASEVTNQPLSQPVELAISTDPIDLPSTQIIYSVPENTHISHISPFRSSIQISLNTPQTLLHPIPTTSHVQPILSTSQPQQPQTKINPDQANPSLIPTRSAPTDRESTTIRRRQSVIARKCAILDKEFKNRAKMQSELHELKKQLLSEQIREAKAKATLLESQQRAQDQIHELQKQLLQKQIREAKLKAALTERKLLQRQVYSEKYSEDDSSSADFESSSEDPEGTEGRNQRMRKIYRMQKTEDFFK